jgi:hypothetical protein
MDFRLFLLRHTALLRVMFRWTIRLLFPRQLSKARLAYEHAAREHLAEPVHPSTAETLGGLFAERRRVAEGGIGPTEERYTKMEKMFAALCGMRPALAASTCISLPW